MGERARDRSGLLRPDPLLLLICAIAGAGALVPALYGLNHHPWPALSYGLLVSGLLAVASGTAVLIWWVQTRLRRPVEFFRVLLSLSVLCWGAGQLTLAGDSFDHVIGYPAPGDVVGSGAAPLALIAMVCLPRRRSISTWPGVRLGLDSLVPAPRSRSGSGARS